MNQEQLIEIRTREQPINQIYNPRFLIFSRIFAVLYGLLFRANASKNIVLNG